MILRVEVGIVDEASQRRDTLWRSIRRLLGCEAGLDQFSNELAEALALPLGPIPQNEILLCFEEHPSQPRAP